MLPRSPPPTAQPQSPSAPGRLRRGSLSLGTLGLLSWAVLLLGIASLSLAGLLLVSVALQPEEAQARDIEGGPGPTPAKNFSNIHSDVAWIEKGFAAAEDARAGNDWASAVRALQAIVDQRSSRESPADAAPYVRAVFGSAVYEGAWIVARHRVAAWGTKALESYEREFGATAKANLAHAIARRDEALIAEVATRFLPLPAGRRAALLLIDLALERSDTDRALGWIEALVDLEAVTTETAEALAPWRAARALRQALALAASPEQVAPIEAILLEADPRQGRSIDAVPAQLLARPPAPRTWPTTGGNAARAAVPESLGSKFTLKWFKPPSSDEDLIDTRDPSPASHDRTSIWLPPRAVATDEHLFVSDGQYLHVYRLQDGRRVVERGAALFPGGRPGGHGTDVSEDRRARYGLLEGHCLSAFPVRDFEGLGPKGWIQRAGPGWLILAAVPDGNPWPLYRTANARERRRNDHVQAFHWDGIGRLTRLWRAGGLPTNVDRARERANGVRGLPADTRLYGAPLLYRGRVWVAGVRPSRATSDRWEAWIYGLDPATGSAALSTHIGTGTPMRTGRMDEVIPTSVAAAHGRVVVGTALGILGAVDASDGRIQWIYRYDRWVETERGRRRNQDRTDEGPRPSSFFNEPPLLALDRCFVTPTDSNKLVVVFNRPRAGLRSMMSHGLTKPGGRNGAELLSEFQSRDELSSEFMAEHIPGVVPGAMARGTAKGTARAASLIVIGQGASGPSPGPIAVSLLATDGALGWPMNRERELLWREENVTGFGAEPYGRALVTAEEVFVPTAQGIVIYELFDRDGDQSHYVGILNQKDLPADIKDAPARPYGNLIPIPGRGLVAVSATTIAFWQKK